MQISQVRIEDYFLSKDMWSGTVKELGSLLELGELNEAAALAAFKIERQKIDANIAEVEALLGGKAKASAAVKEAAEPASKRGRSKRSAAVRAHMGKRLIIRPCASTRDVVFD